MSSRDPIRTALHYIEAHLTDEIGFVDVARAVAFSPFHFHRLYQAATGESITCYIRKRRLDEAAAQLIKTERRILDIAVTYRFESQASFTKAFRRMYGEAPGAYRRKGVHVSMTDGQMQHAAPVAHGIRREPQMVELPERLMVGLEYIGKNQNGEIPALWAAFNRRTGEVRHRVAVQQAIGLCGSVENPKEECEFRYAAGVFVDRADELPAGMVARKVPAGLYAVFTHEAGPEALGRSYEYIWGTWVPGSSYQPAGAHDYELYDERFDAASPTWVMEIHIPVRPRG
ncbi:MAG TPA: AraC family transcriptional regulator [Symbiobacteriaceae bacterium]|nr:AraC family transcriptional regulator [Symbiobacteriaceae bacterium]